MANPFDKFDAQASNPFDKFDMAQAAPAAAAAAVPLSRTDKFLRGMRDPIDGGAQLLANMLPSGVVRAGNQVNNWLADKTGLVGRLEDSAKGQGGVDKMVRDAEATYQARRKASGESGFDGYRSLGSVVPSVALGAATGGAGAGAGLAARVGVGAAQGAVSGALTPATGNGNYWSEKGQQVALGAGLGGATTAALGGVARLISPNASTNPQIALLRKEGVTPTIGQTLGGRANTVEEKLMSLPVVGDMVSKARGSANDQFQRAAVTRALKPVGVDLPQGVAGRNAVQFAENTLKQRYDDVLTNIGAIPADQPFATKVSSLGRMVNKDVLSKEAKSKFGAIVSDVQSAFDSNGMLTSEGFKRVESQLGSDYRSLTSSADIYDGRLAPAVKQLQEELRGLLRRQAGLHADDLQAVNTGWANFKRVQGAASKIGAEDGNFTPAQFQNAVRALDKSKDKGAFARGSALGQDLGDAGKTVLGNKVPNSGTTDRALLNLGLLGGTAAISPTAAGGALLGAGLYTSPAQRALVAAAASRPAAAQPAANALRNASPMLIPGLLQLPLGYDR